MRHLLFLRGVPDFLGVFRAFSGVFLVFLGVIQVFLGCSRFFGGVPGFLVVAECSVMFRCSGVPGSTTCRQCPSFLFQTKQINRVNRKGRLNPKLLITALPAGFLVFLGIS